MIGRCNPNFAAHSSGFVSSSGFASGGGVMSVRMRPSMPRWSTALEKIASIVRISGPRNADIAIGCDVYWKKIAN